MPVVSSRLAECLLECAPSDLQLVPVRVSGTEELHYIVNICSLVPCIAEPETKVTRWLPEDGRPEKVGAFRMVIEPVLTAEQHAGQPIFRAQGWEIMMLCTASLKNVLLRGRFSGLELTDLPCRE
ncbi:MAG: hypothetical protein NTY70_01545 [Burkholderiales bacterium]|nr:hypothetical protein [Burkholderiales bacterium]